MSELFKNWWKDNKFIVFALIIVAVLVAAVFIFNYILKKNNKSTATANNKFSTKDLTVGAVCLALSFCLSCFGYKMPQGGTITPSAILPIALYCYYFGFGKGCIVTIAYTLLQFMQNPYILTPAQVFLDYFAPYLALCATGIFSFNINKYKNAMQKDKPLSAHGGLFGGIGIYIAIRYLSHVLSGAIFFGEYAWEGWAAWPYSIVYNSYVLIDTLIVVLVAIALLSNKAFNKYMASNINTEQKTDTTAENN